MQRAGFVHRRRGGARRRQVPRIKPGADPRLKKVFARIGTPPKKTFKPDRFQLEAVSAIQRSDCLVSAPTGSGKTWIAEQAIERIHAKGGKSWYASPLKALTNSKYLEFGKRFGSENVGILTGDRRENAAAPVIVGTTEILRNQLYDAMHRGVDLPSDLAILDEAHFLADEDRGVVWEEVMMYLPARVHLLLLSATIRNARQVADWLESIRSKPCVVVEETGRPVPLFPLFFHPSGRLLPLLDSKGTDKKVRAYVNNPNPPVLATGRRLPPFGDIMRVLRKYDLLPGIFFMKSRADCDAALQICMDTLRRNETRRPELNRKIDECANGQPHLFRHRQMEHLRNAAVAAHHGGQLPAWKLFVEQRMTEGLLDAVFATSTVAAGVNFPARSVVLLNSDRYNGREFVPLNATEFHQMTGRAGRRGKDQIGFAVVLPGKFMGVRLIADLCTTPPEDVLSRIKMDFSMILNLLLSHSPEEIRGIFERSFATYLNLINQRPGLDKKLREAGGKLMAMLPEALCAGPGPVLDLVRKRSDLTQETSRLRLRLKRLETRLSKLAHLVPGRLFLDRRGRMYCAVKLQPRRQEHGVLAWRVKRRVSRRTKRLRLRWFAPQKVFQVLEAVLDLPPMDHTKSIAELMAKTARNSAPPTLESLPLGENEVGELRPIKSRELFLEQHLEGLPCNKCRHAATCHKKTNKRFRRALEEFALLWDSANAVRMRLWNNFVRHLEFLKEEGFVTEEDKLTNDGAWASRLRLDQPLMIAEGLRRGLFPDSDPALLAALVGPFVHDREMEPSMDESKVPKRLSKAFDRMKKALTPLAERKAVRGFAVRPVALWPAASIYAWANGQPWEGVLDVAGMAEGDLAMLVSRTADNLRQIASLTEVYPAAAKCAADAAALILREPVVTQQIT